jgi:trans-2,3-dihydro-3-hydroxyanthranilate isomerase
MARRPFYWVDAFSGAALGGNPCAVVFDCDDLDSETMLAIAREMNTSETAFVMASATADVRARYFTVREEIPLAGHPTVATVMALVDGGRLRLSGDLSHFTLELTAGTIDIEVLASNGSATAVIMSQLAPRFLRTYDPQEVLPALGLETADLLDGAPVQVVSTGTPQLMVAVKDLDAVRRAAVAPSRYAELCADWAFMSSHVFCLQGVVPGGDTFARHFSHADGSLEDCFTGSSTGGMGAYLWHHGLIATPRFVAQQGHWMDRPGEAGVEVVGPAEAIETVRVAGAARILIRGEMDY